MKFSCKGEFHTRTIFPRCPHSGNIGHAYNYYFTRNKRINSSKYGFQKVHFTRLVGQLGYLDHTTPFVEVLED